MANLSKAKPSQVRELIRKGEIIRPTSGMCAGYAQGNLVILPREMAFDFLLFTQRNPKPCPVLEVSDVGARELRNIAPGSDITRDIPFYRVYRKGELTGEYPDLTGMWRDDFVSFILGCSFTFESALIDEGITVRHIECSCNVPMYITNIDCVPAGQFSGPMVVSMRPIPYHQVLKAVQITSRYPKVHGGPIHIGDPTLIGIKDLSRPDFGDAVPINNEEIPVFWACGVTPQAVAMKVKPELMITHAPGYMFITDLKNHQLADI